MTTIRSFEEVQAWQSARKLARNIYAFTKREPFARDYGLKDQICRAAVSVMSTIAEGHEGQSPNVFIKHPAIAKGSAGEARSQLYVALDQNYTTKSECVALSELGKQVARQIAGLMRYLRHLKPVTCNV